MVVATTRQAWQGFQKSTLLGNQITIYCWLPTIQKRGSNQMNLYYPVTPCISKKLSKIFLTWMLLPKIYPSDNNDKYLVNKRNFFSMKIELLHHENFLRGCRILWRSNSSLIMKISPPFSSCWSSKKCSSDIDFKPKTKVDRKSLVNIIETNAKEIRLPQNFPIIKISTISCQSLWNLV